MPQEPFYATGKRKTAVARVWITPGSGKVTVNRLAADEYFGGIYFEPKLDKPFTVTDSIRKFDVTATVKGGGKSSQIDALVHGIAKALQEMDAENRLPLKKAGLMTRDPRSKERKKYGQRGARARFQFSKR
ncbi:MAG TPA: 30S ribosomal protein S9 [Desulfobacteraceae bacterium]|mgnify:CR=1 FL=1|nr:30S ribosomal protein S9 [Desulfobacteraceae bacterium]